MELSFLNSFLNAFGGGVVESVKSYCFISVLYAGAGEELDKITREADGRVIYPIDAP